MSQANQPRPSQSDLDKILSRLEEKAYDQESNKSLLAKVFIHYTTSRDFTELIEVEKEASHVRWLSSSLFDLLDYVERGEAEIKL